MPRSDRIVLSLKIRFELSFETKRIGFFDIAPYPEFWNKEIPRKGNGCCAYDADEIVESEHVMEHIHRGTVYDDTKRNSRIKTYDFGCSNSVCFSERPAAIEKEAYPYGL